MRRELMKISVVVALLFSGWVSKAQQEGLFTQYMFNPIVLNPAYAGSSEAIDANMLFKKQWLNIDGAPTSMTFSAHSPLFSGMGAGIQFTTDKVGITTENNIMGSYSYTLQVPYKGILADGRVAFGLSAGVTMFESDFNKVSVEDGSDGAFANGAITGTKPNFGTGVYYYTNELYLGVSVPRLLANTFSGTVEEAQFRQSRHFYVSGGYVMDITKDWKFKPNFLVRSVSGAPISIDLNANFLFIEKLWVGASFRLKESIDLLAQFNVTDQLRIGYAYDFTTGEIGKFTSGSHEFMLNYLFSFNRYDMMSPRYF